MPIHVRSGLEVEDGDVSKLGPNTEALVSAISRKSCECWQSDDGAGRCFKASLFYRTPGSALAALHPTQLQQEWPGLFTKPDSFPISDPVSLIHGFQVTIYFNLTPFPGKDPLSSSVLS